MATRRKFLAYTGGSALTLYGYDRLGIRQAYASGIPGGTLDPGDVGKYVTALLVPPVMPTAGRITQTGGKNIDYYEISVKQLERAVNCAAW
jgi:spore coat protein A, manganese oxidase